MTHTAVSQANSALQLPTLEHVYALLKANCKPDRFDGRDGPVWGQEYSWNLAKDRLQDLEKYGKAYVLLWSNLNGHFDRVFSPRQGT
ncbi:TPA: hypothetical protein ACXIMN_003754 [Escherichia coli]